MFLFTSLPEPSTAARVPHAPALQKAAQATGVPFDYLVQTARRESGFKANAAATTSSARGLFQFIEQTWLRMVRSEGAKIGLGAEASAISVDSAGRMRVADAEARHAILALRDDPEVSSQLAARLARANSAQLQSSLGRAPDSAELYAAHFLGPAVAARLIATAEHAPETPAATVAPAAAGANRSVFYTSEGEPRSAAAVLKRISAGFGVAGQAVTATAGAEPHRPTFHALFRSAHDSAVAPNVAVLWRRGAETIGQPINFNSVRS